MRINTENCEGCGICIDYCNVGAISLNEDKVAVINPDVCVECWVCWRNRVCPKDCLEPTPLATEGDVMKHVLSDPTETSAGTGVPGRGTEEAKTNDVTGRFPPDVYGICIDMGRPGVGCYLRDVEKVAMALAAVGVKFPGPEDTPLSAIMTDIPKGKIRDDMLDVHFLSIIVEGTCRHEELPQVMDALLDVEKKIDTVFSLGLVSMKGENHDAYIMDVLKSKNIPLPTRGKVNVGLGKPLFVG